MDFRILGPLEVLEDGRALDLGGQKQRALLAVLLLEANRVVSSGRLIEALWEEEPPDTALKALQVYVSQLRRLLGKERGRDGLSWPHFDGLIWPHPRPMASRPFGLFGARVGGRRGDGIEGGVVRADP